MAAVIAAMTVEDHNLYMQAAEFLADANLEQVEAEHLAIVE